MVRTHMPFPEEKGGTIVVAAASAPGLIILTPTEKDWILLEKISWGNIGVTNAEIQVTVNDAPENKFDISSGRGLDHWMPVQIFGYSGLKLGLVCSNQSGVPITLTWRARFWYFREHHKFRFTENGVEWLTPPEKYQS